MRVHVVTIFTFSIRRISSKRSTVGSLSRCHLSKLTLHLAVEYRLLQHAPVPGALQDAAAVYAYLVTQRLGARRSLDGKYRYPKLPTSDRIHAHDTPTTPDLVPGVSETMDQTMDFETHLRSSAAPPGTEISPGYTGHRQHVETIREDDRRDSVEPLISGNDAIPHSPVHSMHLLTQAKPDAIAARRPRIILIGDSAGGNLVLALARWVRDEGNLPVPDGMILLSPSCDPCTHRLHA
jgi:hypothetical protein